MRSLQTLATLILVLPIYSAEEYVERDFNVSCARIETVARTYLKGRGFTEPECDHCPNSLKSPGQLLDAHGKPVGTLRIRRELAGQQLPFYLWSDAFHARVFLWPKPQPSGCKLGLYIDFASRHTMMIGIIPVGERLGVRSNGKLEAEYLDAILASQQSSN
ncbi:MAG: hypothetical protein JWO19_5279 [Bryobacterales bacterium]|nr:hypothetical protein [Bryobacterales bacterium]